MIVEVLELEEVVPADIESDAPLFGDGLGLDSIDALEIGVEIQKRYGIVFDADDTDVRAQFATIRSLAGLVFARRTK